MEDKKIGSSEKTKSSWFIVKNKLKNELRSYAVLANAGELYISGFCYVKLIYGELSVNGYNLNRSDHEKIYNPYWQPASICSISKTKDKNSLKFLTKALSELDLSIDLKQKTQFDCCFIVEEIPCNQQEWLVSIEDQSCYEYYIHPCDFSKNSSFEEICGLFSFGTGLLLDSYHIQKLHFDAMQYPESWFSISNNILKDIKSDKNNNKITISGAKGVGKSSYLRFLINQILSFNNSVKESKNIESLENSVCVIDCDLGQPEFTIPSMVSLNLVKKPILSPPHLHLKEPEMGFFIGDITTRNNPTIVIKCIKKLIERYEELAKVFNEEMEEKKKEKAKKMVSNNRFNSLLLNDKNTSKNDKNIKLSHLPLIINTDGFIKYMGAEILSAILDLIKPTHLIYLQTEKDLSLPSIDGFLEKQDFEINEKIGLIGEKKGKIEKSKVFYIEPNNRSLLKTVVAADLRNLRFISYFLRHQKSLRLFEIIKQSKKLEENIKSNGWQLKNNVKNINQIKYSDYEPLQLNEDINRYNNIGLYIKNGNLVDVSGVIALAILELNPYLLPFSKVVLETNNGGNSGLNQDFPTSLFLAGFNASIVSLTYDNAKNTENDNKMNKIQELHEKNIKKYKLYYKTNSRKITNETENKDVEVEVKENGVEFSLSCFSNNSENEILPCNGFGIIRNIDIYKKTIVLTTPSLLNTINSDNLFIMLQKGRNLQIPTIFVYSPSFHNFPYQSSEANIGEGSSVARARNNVKRRGLVGNNV